MKKLLVALLGYGVIANAAITIKEGTDYTVVNVPDAKLTSSDKNKIAVMEFFSYSCIHCSALEPTLDQWLASAKSVDFKKVHVVWQDNYLGYAKLNATVQELKLGGALNPKIFDAVMNKRQNLEDTKQLTKFLDDNKNIVDKKKFMSTYNSFTISTKPQEYAQYTQSYNITGTPSFVVAGKYMTMPARPAKLVQILDALVEKAKKEQKSK